MQERKFMKTRMFAIVLSVLCIARTASSWQTETGNQAELKQRFAALKQALAENKARLRKYQWIENTELSVKGDRKKDQQNACHYGPDGSVQKTPIGPPPESKDPPGGLRGKIAKKKIGEMKDYMDRLKGLISHYVPPDPQRIQSSYQVGKENLNLSSGGQAAFTFSDYYKQGDKVTIGFDSASKRLTSYDVETYLDGPKDVVTLSNQFATLPDNTNYLQQTTLTSKSKEIEIQTTNSDYTKIGQ
jgi:hypothetical protein